jgi:Zn-dependent protease
MNPVKILLFAAGFFIFLKAAQYFLAVKALLNLRFKKADGELKQTNELPGYLEKLLPSCDAQLRNLDFSLSQLHLLDSCIVTSFSRQWNIVYLNKNNKCYANVIVPLLPERYEPVKVEFNNIFSDNTRLTTHNGIEYDVIDHIPNVILNDPCAPTLEQQYISHIEKLKALNRNSIELNPQHYLASEIQVDNNYISYLSQKGLLKPQTETTWQLRLLPAMTHAFKILRGMRKKQALRTAQLKAVGAKKIEPIEIPVEVEVNAYLHMEDLHKPAGSGIGWKMMVFFISLLIGIAIFGTAISFSAALFIIAALIVHELGHYIAMALFGYSDRQILILPFGAATVGEKTDADPLQKTLVYLAGPAFGLVAGTVCLIAGARTEIKPLVFCGSFFLILNYINLLPIVPLDGGKLFELALFSRAPVLKSVFTLVSLSLGVIAAILLRDPILIFFVVLMAIGVRTQLLINSAHSKIKKQIKAGQIHPDKQSLLPEIFCVLKRKTFAKLHFAQKYAVSKNLLSALTQKPPGLGETIVSLLLYSAIIALPILIAIPTMILLHIKDRIS